MITLTDGNKVNFAASIYISAYRRDTTAKSLEALCAELGPVKAIDFYAAKVLLSLSFRSDR